jgi:DNA-binding MarR family transcriptional regulator
MRDVKHPGAKSVGWALLQAARLHRARMGEKLGSLSLFAGQEQVLQALAASGSITMTDLAGMLRVRPPTASRTVSRLKAMGLVERHTEAGDARLVRVRLTAEGERKTAALGELWDAVEREMLDGFDSKERRRLRKLLRRGARNLADANGSDLRGLEAADEEVEERPAPKPKAAAPAAAR